ncbi:MAG: hypothetical protein LBQ51_10700 [Desulfovibrio sp.]|jgi:hypothetical protein|nr:hypothetical protein [Desulfovibrio sp.]
MITDQFNIFFDNVATAATANSVSIPLMPWMGRNEPVNVTAIVSGSTNTKPVTLAVKLQESADNAAFTDVATFAMTKADTLGAVLVFALPYNLRERYVRLSYTLTLGSGETAAATNFKIWAGVTRDDFEPYERGQYIDAGKVVA